MPARVFRVLVQGPSMAPTLRAGDHLLVRRGAGRLVPGSVVVVDLPDRGLAVKRLQHVDARGGVWVVGDNPLASTDSTTLGALPADRLVGVVVARLWPKPGRIRRSAQRN